MSSNVSPTALVDTESRTEDGVASVADIAANDQQNSTARVVRDYYASVLPLRVVREGTEDRDVVVHSTVDRFQERGGRLRAPVLPERRLASIASYFALQEWEGYVTSIGSKTFTADLVDMTRFAKHANEQVELPLEEIGAEERRELRAGSIFRWTIGYETLPSGQRRRVSQLVFRQLPRWSQADIDAANRLGHDRHRQIKWE